MKPLPKRPPAKQLEVSDPPAAWEWQVFSCKFTLFTHLLSSNSHQVQWESCNLKGRVISLCPANEWLIILISEWLEGFYWKSNYTLNLKVTIVALNTYWEYLWVFIQYLWATWLPYPEMVTFVHFCSSGSLKSNLFRHLFGFEKICRLQTVFTTAVHLLPGMNFCQRLSLASVFLVHRMMTKVCLYSQGHGVPVHDRMVLPCKLFYFISEWNFPNMSIRARCEAHLIKHLSCQPGRERGCVCW